MKELYEIRNDPYDSAHIYKDKTNAFHDQMISRKEFNVGQKVLLHHTCLWLFLSKLWSRWIGPYIVTEVYPHGVVDIQSLETNKICEVNEHRLKQYYEKMPIEEINEIYLADSTYKEA